MTQEDKELLLKDLCARLPYKPIVKIDDCGIWDLRGVDHDDSAELRDRVIVWHGENYPSSKNSFPIINCKPYLLPLSSMTEEQRNDISKLLIDTQKDYSPYGELNMKGCDNLFICTVKQANALINYCLNNHLDINGLIEKGLAIDATGLNIY
jgi:hypothetical protein